MQYHPPTILAALAEVGQNAAVYAACGLARIRVKRASGGEGFRVIGGDLFEPIFHPDGTFDVLSWQQRAYEGLTALIDAEHGDKLRMELLDGAGGLIAKRDKTQTSSTHDMLVLPEMVPSGDGDPTSGMLLTTFHEGMKLINQQRIVEPLLTFAQGTATAALGFANDASRATREQMAVIFRELTDAYKALGLAQGEVRRLSSALAVAEDRLNLLANTPPSPASETTKTINEVVEGISTLADAYLRPDAKRLSLILAQVTPETFASVVTDSRNVGLKVLAMSLGVFGVPGGPLRSELNALGDTIPPHSALGRLRAVLNATQGGGA